MSQLAGHARNLHLMIEADPPIPVIEVVLLVAEPVYEPRIAAGFTKRHALAQLRFTATPESLRDLAHALIEHADEAERLAAKLKP